VICSICNKKYKLKDMVPLYMLESKLIKTMKSNYPHVSVEYNTMICLRDLKFIYFSYVKKIVHEEKAQYLNLQERVIKSLQEHETETERILREEESKETTFAEKAADIVASFGGSWKFIISFIIFITIWSVVNVLLPIQWDPYPFILLNLCLSMIAAVQAPVIMMSQNRQDSKDRARALLDYKINLTAELQIRHINAKLDQLLLYHWPKLLEIQEIQASLMKDTFFLKEKNVSIPQEIDSISQYWNMEIEPDPLFYMLMERFYDKENLIPQMIVFEDRYNQRDNFIGYITSLQIDKNLQDESLLLLKYELVFKGEATLDTVLDGENEQLRIRNCSDLPELKGTGHIIEIEIFFENGKIEKYKKEMLPERFKPTFAYNYIERLNDLWKLPIKKLKISYIPGKYIYTLKLSNVSQMKIFTANFFLPENKTEANLYMGEDINLSIYSPNELKKYCKKIAHFSLKKDFNNNNNNQNIGTIENSLVLHLELNGPHIYYFFCEECKVILYGLINLKTR
jgi:uncharacterized membrane protein